MKKHLPAILIGLGFVLIVSGVYIYKKTRNNVVDYRSVDWLNGSAVVVIDGKETTIKKGIGIGLANGMSLILNENSLILQNGDGSVNKVLVTAIG